MKNIEELLEHSKLDPEFYLFANSIQFTSGLKSSSKSESSIRIRSAYKWFKFKREHSAENSDVISLKSLSYCKVIIAPFLKYPFNKLKNFRQMPLVDDYYEFDITMVLIANISKITLVSRCHRRKILPHV